MFSIKSRAKRAEAVPPAKLKSAEKKTAGLAESRIKELSLRVEELESLNRELLEKERHLRQLAYIDSLTGLNNRALFIDHLNLALQRAIRYEDYRFAVLFIDLDRFKSVNDSLGHTCGDQLLTTIAQRLQGGLRQVDIIARLGGDEFAVLIDHVKRPTDAIIVAESVLQLIGSPVELDGHQVFPSASIGIALSNRKYGQAEDIMRDADTAMHRAKNDGRARAELFDKSMHAQAVSVLQFSNELRRAVGRAEFCNHYQPIMSLKTGELTGFEALVRWEHPERGLVPPVDFIPLAEDTGMIVPIGFFVLEEACNQLRRWQQEFPNCEGLTMSVNLSGKQLNHSELVSEVAAIITKTGIDPQYLKLEITESVVMENAAKATAILKELRGLGVRLAIDDFGTGYSSLSYLRRFPVDILKIDRAFVSRMSIDREDYELVRTIVDLAHLLKMEVVAEGIETSNQQILLRTLKCEYGQGYLYSKPMRSVEADRYVQEKKRTEIRLPSAV
jgi:diguanylate cyclase (GGDEF)-like protein